ncbi:hypothetical protein HNQ95_003292 [Aminobacter ciceronei]|uniref:Uncharacterized protein n=1 Tax=Aminobacter ciceronei TaxID=150723 RepID=A0ABR6C8P8_9HYPH|nr:hypothetical protein [Aminobacter ciceronei]MBA9021391.1 hypothetical protein [Aminobacter ciceronei]
MALQLKSGGKTDKVFGARERPDQGVQGQVGENVSH